MKIGIVGVSGFGGGELLRLCAGHPAFEIAYVAGESTAGKSLSHLFPALGGHAAGRLVSCLEGGYHLPSLARSVAAHVRVLLGAD